MHRADCSNGSAAAGRVRRADHGGIAAVSSADDFFWLAHLMLQVELKYSNHSLAS